MTLAGNRRPRRTPHPTSPRPRRTRAQTTFLPARTVRAGRRRSAKAAVSAGDADQADAASRSTFMSHVDRRASDALRIGPNEVIRTGLIPQNSRMVFLI